MHTNCVRIICFQHRRQYLVGDEDSAYNRDLAVQRGAEHEYKASQSTGCSIQVTLRLHLFSNHLTTWCHYSTEINTSSSIIIFVVIISSTFIALQHLKGQSN